MSAPAPVVRTLPVGYKMPDGFSSKLACASAPGMQVWEKEVKPPGIDGGESIDTTTMHNVTWRTKDTRKLKTLTESSIVCGYDPDSKTDIENAINRNQAWTILWPTGDSLTFYANLQKAEYGGLKEGEFPEVTLTIMPTNWDPVNHVEAGPVYTAVSGT